MIHNFYDLKADENSVWENYSVKETYHIIINIDDNKTRQIMSTKKENNLNKTQNAFNCNKYFYKNLSNEGFYRKIIRFRGVDKENKVFDKCFLGYFWKEVEQNKNSEFLVSNHGNSKRNNDEYFRSENKVKTKVKELIRQKGSMRKNYENWIDTQISKKLTPSQSVRN